MSNLLTVAVPTYNSEKCLPRLLDSFAEQDFSSCNIFISDDGSSDGTSGLVQAFATKHPGVVSYESHENIGVGATRNLILDKIDSPYVWFVDHDDEIRPGCIEKIVQVLEAVTPEILWMGRVVSWEMPTGWPEAVYEPRRIAKESMMTLMGFAPWNKVFEVALLKSSGASFTRFFGEDVPMTLLSVASATRLYRIDAPVYRHISSVNSVTNSSISSWMMSSALKTKDEIRSLEQKFPHYRQIFEFRLYEFLVWIVRYLLRQQHQFPEERGVGEYLRQFEDELKGVCSDNDNPYIAIAERENLRILEQKNRILSEKVRRIEVACSTSLSWRLTKPLRWCFSVLSGSHFR